MFMPPWGKITSAHRLLGSMNCSWLGRTVVRYCSMMLSTVRPRSHHVAPQPADQPDVGLGVDVDAQVEALAQRRLVQHEDPLDHHDPCRVHHPHVRAARVLGVVVDRHGHGRAGGEGGDVVVQQLEVERVRMVVVERLPDLERLVGERDVVRIELDQGQVLLAGELRQPLAHRGLARAGAAGDADEERRADGGCLYRGASAGQARPVHPEDPTDSSPAALTERQRAIITFERSWWNEEEARDTVIRARFACSSEDYYRELNELLDSPAALSFDPLVVRRLQRQRERRRRARLDGPHHSSAAVEPEASDEQRAAASSARIGGRGLVADRFDRSDHPGGRRGGGRVPDPPRDPRRRRRHHAEPGGVTATTADGGAEGSLPISETTLGDTTAPTPAAPTTVAPVTTGATVVVANASNVNRVAASFSTALEAKGFTMGTPADASGPDLATSVVYYVAIRRGGAAGRHLRRLVDGRDLGRADADAAAGVRRDARGRCDRAPPRRHGQGRQDPRADRSRRDRDDGPGRRAPPPRRGPPPSAP